jgi:glycosyltransferase involved in cell wall biosynthesis
MRVSPYGSSTAFRRLKSVSISLLVPMYNEEESTDLFLDTVQPLLSEITDDYEIICVSDGSTDATVERLLERRAMDRRIKIIELSRNFGKEAALSAAIDVCSKDVAIPIDVDLQDPPELIGQMIEKWREGYEVVYAVARSGHMMDCSSVPRPELSIESSACSRARNCRTRPISACSTAVLSQRCACCLNATDL